MKKTLAIIASLGALAVAMPASATVLTAGSGWQDDTLTAAGDPTLGSDWTFTIGSLHTLAVVDCCVVGDTYTLSGGLAGVTSFYAGAADVRSTGSYGSYWLDAAYSKLALTVGPGTYTFSITGDGVGGLPAGLGVRLDAGGIPEPATWAFMILGFGLVGAAMRRRQKAAVRFAF